ncbi:hypothetical protein MLD38_008776 [Melastoma candidum]|uniref:Uncharacterized protein n=1 Tax=Melastoma candidum TaxID=119954 RepID=A0ACB9RV56_9MYRT|nr:hypothetical protein MLD38_008776 [Melastoma candidum]
MAATLHAKMNRKQLSKLDIIKICEEILNPSVPMALRLSGILMGGVVIVYEKKVKLLYDDVNRLLVEINEAWKVKSATDPTVLPKRKLQARKEAVTLPDNPGEDVEEEKSIDNSDGTATFMRFQHTAYFKMRLDTLDEPCEEREEEQLHQFHQADAADITLPETFDTFQSERNSFRHYERFDIEGDEDTLTNFPSAEAHIPAATSLLPSPPKMPPDEMEVTNQQGNNFNPQRDESNRDHLEEQRRGQSKRNVKRKASFVMDFERTIIPGPTYQSWLHDSADIVSRQRRKLKGPTPSVKIVQLMELPPLVLGCGLIQDDQSIHYPAPLMELWRKSSQPPPDLPSGGTSEQPPPPPSSTSRPNRVYNEDRDDYDFQHAMEDPSHGESTEKMRFGEVQGMSAERFAELFENNIRNNGATANVPGDDVRSIHSSDSGHNIISDNSGANSRSNKRHRVSSSGNSNNGLEPVAEESSWLHVDLNLKLSRLSENGLTPTQELVVETGPTQTPYPIKTPPFDKLTETIHSQMKAHFDSPGGPPSESLNHLTTGMTRKGAALLFYQTCVLATRDILKVEQRVPYGDILISKGAKM